MKLYHCSLKLDYKPGDIIHPSSEHQYSGGWGVYCTGSPTAHYTLFSFGERSIGKKRHNVYQVKLLHKSTKIQHGGCWDELIVAGAVEVVACLGEANKNKNRSSVENSRKKGMRLIVFEKAERKKAQYKGYKGDGETAFVIPQFLSVKKL